MKLTNNNTPKHCKSGMTLLELTVVILVLLSLISILFIGARGWKAGSDRAGCILNIRNAQLGVRSYQNLYGKPEGTALNMATEIIGTGGYLSPPKCPAGGTYAYITYIPFRGELALACSLSTSGRHLPVRFSDW